MSLSSLANAQAELALWDACIEALTTGQSYQIGGRTLTRVQLGEALHGRSVAQRAVEAFQARARADCVDNEVEPGFKVARWSGLSY